MGLESEVNLFVFRITAKSCVPVHSRVDAVVAGANADAVDAANVADVVEVHCSERKERSN